MSEEQESQQTEQEIRHELIKRNLKAKLKIDYYRKKKAELLRQKEVRENWSKQKKQEREQEELNKSEDIKASMKRPAEAAIIRSMQKGKKSSYRISWSQ